MAYPAVAARRPILWWIGLFTFWFYGTLAVQVWAYLRRPAV